MTPQQLVELHAALSERLYVATIELTTLVHKHTGVSLTPEAIDELRRRLSWHLALSASAVIDQEAQRVRAEQLPAQPRFCQRWCCRSGRWLRRWLPLPLSLLAVVHALAPRLRG